MDVVLRRLGYDDTRSRPGHWTDLLPLRLSVGLGIPKVNEPHFVLSSFSESDTTLPCRVHLRT